MYIYMWYIMFLAQGILETFNLLKGLRKGKKLKNAALYRKACIKKTDMETTHKPINIANCFHRKR